MTVWLVTGATGFIGNVVGRKLLAQGDEVRILARSLQKAAPLAEAGAILVEGDITDRDAVEKAVAGANIVVHSAAHVQDFGPAEVFRRVNVDGTRHVAEACAKQGVGRFVHVSTIGVYGDRLFHASVDEMTPPRKLGHPYTDTKVDAEHFVRRIAAEHDLPTTIVRPGNIYGPGNYAILYALAKAMRAGALRLVNGGRGRGAFLFVEDLADGVLRAARAQNAVGETYNLVNSEPATWKDLYDGIARVTGLPPVTKTVPLWQARLAARFVEWQARVLGGGKRPPVTRFGVEAMGHDILVSGEKAGKELGFAPSTNLEKGLEASADWLNGVLLRSARRERSGVSRTA